MYLDLLLSPLTPSSYASKRYRDVMPTDAQDMWKVLLLHTVTLAPSVFVSAFTIAQAGGRALTQRLCEDHFALQDTPARPYRYRGMPLRFTVPRCVPQTPRAAGHTF